MSIADARLLTTKRNGITCVQRGEEAAIYAGTELLVLVAGEHRATYAVGEYYQFDADQCLALGPTHVVAGNREGTLLVDRASGTTRALPWKLGACVYAEAAGAFLGVLRREGEPPRLLVFQGPEAMREIPIGALSPLGLPPIWAHGRRYALEQPWTGRARAISNPYGVSVSLTSGELLVLDPELQRCRGYRHTPQYQGWFASCADRDQGVVLSGIENHIHASIVWLDARGSWIHYATFDGVCMAPVQVAHDSGHGLWLGVSDLRASSDAVQSLFPDELKRPFAQRHAAFWLVGPEPWIPRCAVGLPAGGVTGLSLDPATGAFVWCGDDQFGFGRIADGKIQLLESEAVRPQGGGVIAPPAETAPRWSFGLPDERLPAHLAPASIDEERAQRLIELTTQLQDEGDDGAALLQHFPWLSHDQVCKMLDDDLPLDLVYRQLRRSPMGRDLSAEDRWTLAQALPEETRPFVRWHLLHSLGIKTTEDSQLTGQAGDGEAGDDEAEQATKPRPNAVYWFETSIAAAAELEVVPSWGCCMFNSRSQEIAFAIPFVPFAAEGLGMIEVPVAYLLTTRGLVKRGASREALRAAAIRIAPLTAESPEGGVPHLWRLEARIGDHSVSGTVAIRPAKDEQACTVMGATTFFAAADPPQWLPYPIAGATTPVPQPFAEAEKLVDVLRRKGWISLAAPLSAAILRNLQAILQANWNVADPRNPMAPVDPEALRAQQVRLFFEAVSSVTAIACAAEELRAELPPLSR
jgi:hypothetical protein